MSNTLDKLKDDLGLSEEKIQRLDTLLLREAYIKRAGFAVPCREAIDLISTFDPLVEVGAGSGFWSRLLREGNVDIVPTDPKLSYEAAITHDAHLPCLRLQAKTAIRRYPSRNVLMVWPAYGETWPTQALKAMKIGTILIYVGEDEGGCCADDNFFEVLKSDFDAIATQKIPVFYGMHDRLMVFRKRNMRRRSAKHE